MKLYKQLRKRLVNGLVGVEIEVEGEGLLHENTVEWRADKDGSLRGENAEYILQKPLSPPAVFKALDNLRDALVKLNSKITWSFRTSVHIHLNMLRLTDAQIKNVIYTYLLLENILIEYCGEDRIGNRFCLRVADAEGFIDALHRYFTTNRLPERDRYRYAAINLDALSKFGSLEFRSMRGTLDKETLETWIGSLVRLRSFAMKMESPEQIFQTYLERGGQEFLEMVVGKVNAKRFAEGKNVDDYIDRGASLTMYLLRSP